MAKNPRRSLGLLSQHRKDSLLELYTGVTQGLDQSNVKKKVGLTKIRNQCKTSAFANINGDMTQIHAPPEDERRPLQHVGFPGGVCRESE